MLLVYENKDKGISAEWKKTVHMPPHLHEAIEVVYVTNGNIALGVGMELYNMDEGDFASKILLHEPHPDVHFLFLTPDFWDCIFVILSKILKELPDLYKGK